MARKPLIAPGSFKPDVPGSGSLMENIINRDREKRGQPVRSEATQETTADDATNDSKIAIYQDSNLSSDIASSLDREVDSNTSSESTHTRIQDPTPKTTCRTSPTETLPRPPASTAGAPSRTTTSKPSLDRKIASYQDSNIESKIGSLQDSEVDSKVAAAVATPLAQLNLRTPEGLRDWLDEESHQGRKDGINKQILLSLALQLLMLEVEGGRPVREIQRDLEVRGIREPRR